MVKGEVKACRLFFFLWRIATLGVSTWVLRIQMWERLRWINYLSEVQ